jgi:hypothetical protein
MPTIKRTVVLEAGESANPIQGSQYEFLPWPALLEFIALATGTAVEGSIFTGSDVLLEPTELDQRAITEPLNWDDDPIVQDVVGGGERLGVQVRNTHASEERTVRVAIRITPA